MRYSPFKFFFFDNIKSALAIVNIYNQNYEEDWSLEHYGYILRNAADWVAYYDISRAIWTRVFENKNPEASQSKIFLDSTNGFMSRLGTSLLIN